MNASGIQSRFDAPFYALPNTPAGCSLDVEITATTNPNADALAREQYLNPRLSMPGVTMNSNGKERDATIVTIVPDASDPGFVEVIGGPREFSQDATGWPTDCPVLPTGPISLVAERTVRGGTVAVTVKESKGGRHFTISSVVQRRRFGRDRRYVQIAVADRRYARTGLVDLDPRRPVLLIDAATVAGALNQTAQIIEAATVVQADWWAVRYGT